MTSSSAFHAIAYSMSTIDFALAISFFSSLYEPIDNWSVGWQRLSERAITAADIEGAESILGVAYTKDERP
jgi:hypothetical protein